MSYRHHVCNFWHRSNGSEKCVIYTNTTLHTQRHNGLSVISIHQTSKFGQTVVLLLYILQGNDFRNNKIYIWNTCHYTKFEWPS